MAEQLAKVFDPTPKNQLDVADEKKKNASRDFFWDQLVKIATSGMLLVSALDIITSLSSEPVHCYGPDDFSRPQSDYMNSYCSEQTPRVDFLLFYIIGQAIVLVGPHIMWSLWFSGRLAQFSSEALALQRHREVESGRYPHSNVVTAKSLQQIFGASRTIHVVYVLKTIGQLILAAGAAFSAGLGFRQPETRPFIFNTVFMCKFNGPYPNLLDSEEHFGNVTCAVPVLRSHYAVWITNFALLGLILLSTLFALLWWLAPHAAILNWNQAALFSLHSGMEPRHYRGRRHGCSFAYRIKTDLDFLLLRLYGQDEGHGKVLHDLLVTLAVEDYVNEAKEELSLNLPALRTESFLLPNVPRKDREVDIENLFKEYTPGDLRQCLSEILVTTDFGFRSELIQQEISGSPPDETPERTRSESTPQKIKVTIDLAFANPGFSLFLAPISERAATVNFDHHFLSKTTSARKFPTGISEIHTRSDIYAQPLDANNDFSTKFNAKFLNVGQTGLRAGTPKDTVDLFLVGPFSDADRLITIHWFLIKHKEYATERTKLLVLTPTEIAGHDVKKTFKKFEPIWPWGMMLPNSEEYSAGMHCCKSCTFQCGDVQCTFDVAVYKKSILDSSVHLKSLSNNKCLRILPDGQVDCSGELGEGSSMFKVDSFEEGAIALKTSKHYLSIGQDGVVCGKSKEDLCKFVPDKPKIENGGILCTLSCVDPAAPEGRLHLVVWDGVVKTGEPAGDDAKFIIISSE